MTYIMNLKKRKIASSLVVKKDVQDYTLNSLKI